MSRAYEDEQRELTARVKVLQAELDQAQDKTANVERFVSLVRRYTEVEELTPKILNEFIKRIIIYTPDKSSGKRLQKVKVIYNLVENIPMREKRTA